MEPLNFKESLKYKINRIAKDQKLKKTILIGSGVVVLYLIILLSLTKVNNTSIMKYVEYNSSEPYVIIENKEGTYYGGLENFKFTGEAEFQYLSGASYSGEYEKGQRENIGIFEWKNGDTYQGEWKNDNMLDGTYTFSNGDQYKGTFTNNKINKGVYTFGNSCEQYGFSKCEIEFTNGSISKYDITLSDGTVYLGEKTGTAKIVFGNGEKYDGATKDFVENGEGTYYWNDGSHYIGSWTSGKMNGNGKYYYTSESFPYITGSFVNGVPDGKAQYYRSDSEVFETNWKNGQCTSVEVKN